MSMVLRSTKGFRLFAELARRPIFNSHQETKGPIRLLGTTFTQRPTSTIQQPSENVNRSLNKLDQEVRRTGRITRRDIEQVLDEIRHCGTASSSQSLLLIQCCGNLVPGELPKSRMTFVRDLWQTLNNLNVPMDISHYNALLQVYLENELSFDPIEFVADMEFKGVEPNRVTYQRLIYKYCQEGDIGNATKVVEFMHEEQLPINEHVFNALIMGHSQANDIQSAVDVLPTMKQAGLEPSSDTYTHLLCAYAKHGMTDEILSTLNKIRLPDKDLFTVIYKLATNGHSDFVDNVLARLRKLTGYHKHAANLIMRLISKKGHDDVVLKVLQTIPPVIRSDGESVEIGSYFIKQLIESGRSTEKIVSVCRELQRIGLNNRAALIAAKLAATAGDVDIAIPLFREVHANGLALRQDYFRPLLKGTAGTDKLLDVLRVMQSEFGMTVNGETVRDYVIPNLKERNYEKIILTLETFGVPKPVAVTSCLWHALQNNRINAAATLASTYAIYYQPSLLRRPLTDALIKTNDVRSWVSIVRSVYENLPRLEKIQSARNEQKDESENQTRSEVVGMLVVDAVLHLQGSREKIAEKILSALVEQGLSCSAADAERVKELLGSLLTPTISFLLEKLSSGKLEPIPYKSTLKQFNLSDIMSSKRLAELIQQREANGEYTKGLQWALLQSHLKANNVQKTDELIDDLLTGGFVLTTPTCVQLIELYCTNGHLDKALAVYADIKSKDPDFVLDALKTMKIVHGLVTNNRIDEAVDFIISGPNGSQKLDGELGVQYNVLCWRLLNHLAEEGRDGDLTKVFNALEQWRHIEANNKLLGLLVKVHIVNKNVTEAMSSFESLSAKYNCTPWKNELSCTLIQLKDGTGLQYLVDLSTKHHGEVNSLYDVVFAFIECGCIQEARRILKTPALQRQSQALIDACVRYRHERKTPSPVLETLLQATSDLQNFDRHEIRYNLLLAYCKEDSPIKAMNLWTRTRKEGDVADKFLTTLASFLNEKGIKIPFDVPMNNTTHVNVKKMKFAPNKLKMMLADNELDGATEHILEMLESESYPSSNTFRSYLNSMASAGQYQALERLSPRLSAEFKQKILFYSRLGKAYSVAGKAEQFFDQTIQNCYNAKNEGELEAAFPSGAIEGILQTHPELVLKFDKFAVDMAEIEFLTPMNILWLHHFENGRLDEADRIVKNYLHTPPPALFNKILRSALYRNDESIVLNLLNALGDKNLSENDLAAIHNCLIDVYCSQQKFDEALKAVDSAIMEVSLESIKTTTLISVKDGLEAEGKVFPHEIPDKKKLNAAGGIRRNRRVNDELRSKWDEFRQILADIFKKM